MSEVSGCRWYNPCSWFNCYTEAEDPNPKQPFLQKDEQEEAPKTPESQKRTVTTPGNTPTKSPTVKGEEIDTKQQWD